MDESDPFHLGKGGGGERKGGGGFMDKMRDRRWSFSFKKPNQGEKEKEGRGNK